MSAAQSPDVIFITNLAWKIGREVYIKEENLVRQDRTSSSVQSGYDTHILISFFQQNIGDKIVKENAMKHLFHEPLSYNYFDSPVGSLLLAADEENLRVVGFPSGSRAVTPSPSWYKNAPPFAETIRQLRAYFAKELTKFELPLLFTGTPFQESVWRELRQIPYGTTMSYGALADKIGKPKASRAVGAANGANPLPIIIPCHRVIGKDKSLTGFGGGIETKRFLLSLEQEHGSDTFRST